MSQAAACYERAVAISPDHLDAYNNLANTLAALGKVDRAIACFERALSIRLDARLHFNLANVLVSHGRNDEAIRNLEQALLINPDYAEAHNNLGNMTGRRRGYIQATRYLSRAVELKPDFAEAHNNLGLILQNQGAIGPAITHLERALSLRPDYVAAYNNLLFALNYAPNTDLQTVYQAHLDFAQRYEVPVASATHIYANDRTLDRRIRVGYVSSDFRRHSVAYFIEPVLDGHDRSKFEIFGYYNYAEEDEVTHRLKKKVDHWRSIIGASDEAVVSQMWLDQIDILVDLNGHTTKNRLLVFARKPAPVQVTWLGYPNTTGLSAMDYRITDGVADPVGMSEAFHSEELIRLPECFSCYQPPEDAPDVSPLPALTNGWITFGSFNKLAKTNSEVIATWAKLLCAIPRSRLVLKAAAFVEQAMREKILSEFSALGVARERLELLGHDTSQKSHLEQYNKIDIALDPFPYNGTTTTCEALWMGVPVITLAGRTHVGRVGVSQMSSLGLTEFVCRTPDEYVGTAQRLAADLGSLKALRQGMRSRMSASPLMDAQRLTQNLEQAYLNVWGRWLQEIR